VCFYQISWTLLSAWLRNGVLCIYILFTITWKWKKISKIQSTDCCIYCCTLFTPKFSLVANTYREKGWHVLNTDFNHFLHHCVKFSKWYGLSFRLLNHKYCLLHLSEFVQTHIKSYDIPTSILKFWKLMISSTIPRKKSHACVQL